ncbi:MAG: outer membrane beta-barrel protein [Rhodospirillales bacterium]|nr:outer membrane beta-barrel protein [Rhodospirillales bacterium]MCB9980228.1 outer membrane beta-barrel protein [Rhodospirillales bacterium]
MKLLHSNKPLKISLLLSLMLSGAVAAMADPYIVPMSKRNQELSVFLRSNPGLEPTGFDVGRFKVFPVLTAQAEHTDNLYASETNKENDTIYTLEPAISLESDFDRHQLNLTLTGEQTFHQKNIAENYTEYGIDLSSRYDLTENVALPLQLIYQQNTSRRGSPDDQDGLEPTKYETLTARTGALYSGQVLEFGVTAQVADITYEDTPTALGLRNNQDRNRTETRGYAHFGLTRDRPLVPYLFGGYRSIKYDQAFDDSGYNRSADEGEGGVGARFSLSSLTQSQVQVGYAHRNVDDPRLPAVNALTYLANIVWEPSTLLAFSLSGKRQLEETTLADLSASIDSTLNLSAIYEITPRIFVRPKLEFLQKDYKGLTTAKLERKNVGIDLNYKMNKNLWWSAKYEYITQKDKNNSPSIGNFDRNNFLVSLRLQF